MRISDWSSDVCSSDLKELRPAMQPRIDLAQGYEQGKDAQLSIELEILPKVEAPSTDGLKLEKLVVPVSDAAVEEALQNIAVQSKSYKDAPKTRQAATGDQQIGRASGREGGCKNV